jgi:hypothetical protein
MVMILNFDDAAHCCIFTQSDVLGSKVLNNGAQNNWQGAWSHSSMDLTYGTDTLQP